MSGLTLSDSDEESRAGTDSLEPIRRGPAPLASAKTSKVQGRLRPRATAKEASAEESDDEDDAGLGYDWGGFLKMMKMQGATSAKEEKRKVKELKEAYEAQVTASNAALAAEKEKAYQEFDRVFAKRKRAVAEGMKKWDESVRAYEKKQKSLEQDLAKLIDRIRADRAKSENEAARIDGAIKRIEASHDAECAKLLREVGTKLGKVEAETSFKHHLASIASSIDKAIESTTLDISRQEDRVSPPSPASI